MKTILTIFVCFLYVMSIRVSIASNVTQTEYLTIGVYVSPPYVIHDASNTYSGYAIDILNKALHSSGINKKIIFKEYGSIALLLSDIRNLDIAVSSISFTPDRLETMEFSQPFDEGGLGVLVKSNDSLVNGYSVAIYIYIAMGLIIAGLLLTLFDRYYNPDFTKNWLAGYSESMYHVVSVILRGNSNHAPVFNKTLQYWISILWMFSGSAFMSFVMVTYMGIMKTDPEISTKEKLLESHIAVQKGSSAEYYLKNTGSLYFSYPGIAETIDALVKGQVDAVIGDKAMLSYYEHIKNGLPIEVLQNFPVNKELYGYAFPLNSPLRKIIDEKLLEYYTNGKIDGIKSDYGVTD